MKVVAFVSLCYLISESASECIPTDWKNRTSCLCYNVDSHPEFICVVRNATDLNIVSENYGHNLTKLYVNIYASKHLPSSVLRYDNLTELVINGVELISVDDDAFVEIKESLSILMLSNTGLKRIPISAISQLRKLTKLNMERNQIISLNESLRSIRVHTLILRDNFIVEIGRDVLPETLAYLDLSGNKLKFLNGSLRGDLTYLEMSDNDIESLDGELNELPKLRHLKARRNKIHTIEETFSNVPQIRTILLHYNYITEIHNGLRGLANLAILGLRHNKLQVIDPEAFVDLAALTKLTLGSNDLEYLDNNSFNCLIGLRYLDISFNKFRNLNFLVSREAPTQRTPLCSLCSSGQALDTHKVLCTFRDELPLRSLNMNESGIECNDQTRPDLEYIGSKVHRIKGNPCKLMGLPSEQSTL